MSALQLAAGMPFMPHAVDDPLNPLSPRPLVFSPDQAEWIHFTLFGILLPTIKPKVYTFRGL